MTRPTYDDLRNEAEPCLGGCGKLVTHPPRYCNKCGSRVLIFCECGQSEHWCTKNCTMAEMHARRSARPETQGGTE